MNSLLFDSISLKPRCSTPQPGQRRNLCRPARPLWLLTKRLTCLFRGWPHERRGPLPCRVASSSSSDHSCHSHGAAPDALCMVCGSYSLTSCPVCEQDFCSIHLYNCSDCGNQCCGRCLDDHRAEGHWTDSDTVVELNRGWKASSVSALWPTGKPSFVAPGVESEQFANPAHSCANSAVGRNKSSSGVSQFSTLLASRFARVLCAVRSCLSWLGARKFRNMFSKSARHLEACL